MESTLNHPALETGDGNEMKIFLESDPKQIYLPSPTLIDKICLRRPLTVLKDWETPTHTIQLGNQVSFFKSWLNKKLR